MLSEPPPPPLNITRYLDNFHHEDERDGESDENDEEREDRHEESAEPRSLLTVSSPPT